MFVVDEKGTMTAVHFPTYRRRSDRTLQPTSDGGSKTSRDMTRQLTAIIRREGDGYVALCPEVDAASQGGSVDEARANLQEALELFFETASKEEARERLNGDVYVTHVEIGPG